MFNMYSAKSELYHQFALCIKYRCQRSDYTSYASFYDLLENEGWFQQADLQRISDDVNPSGRYLASGKILSNPKSETAAVLEHESGAEIWIIPVATFVAGAIASGVIGNAAYDLIRKMYSMLVKARQKSDTDLGRSFIARDDERYTFSIILRTPDYETIDISQLPMDRQLELIQRTISYRLLQLRIEREETTETRSLERRVEGLENQLNVINLSHLQLMNEFQKERTEWRSRTSDLSARLTRLEETNKGKFPRKMLGK
jgi:hypothetical protein